jgi:bacillithiol synthase
LAEPRDVDRQALVAALRSGAERWGARPAQREALERLAHPDSRVVVTGQQVGWLLGPTYTLSKAVTALRLARDLDLPERPVVPVFWMATQDHDVAEIDHAWVLGRDERVHRLHLPLRPGPAVGRAALDPAWIEAAAGTCGPSTWPTTAGVRTWRTSSRSCWKRPTGRRVGATRSPGC